MTLIRGSIGIGIGCQSHPAYHHHRRRTPYRGSNRCTNENTWRSTTPRFVYCSEGSASPRLRIAHYCVGSVDTLKGEILLTVRGLPRLTREEARFDLCSLYYYLGLHANLPYPPCGVCLDTTLGRYGLHSTPDVADSLPAISRPALPPGLLPGTECASRIPKIQGLPVPAYQKNTV